MFSIGMSEEQDLLDAVLVRADAQADTSDDCTSHQGGCHLSGSLITAPFRSFAGPQKMLRFEITASDDNQLPTDRGLVGIAADTSLGGSGG